MKSLDGINVQNIPPSVVMASPGMMQSGLSREIFEKWCHDSRNGVIVTGYCIENTLANEILKAPEEITKVDGTKTKLEMSVETVNFSAHADYQ